MKLALTLCATAFLAFADVKSEIAAVQDAMDKANSAKDGDAYGKHLTPGYVGVTRSGTVRNRTGDRIQTHVTLVYIKQANVWKLASRSSTNIQPAP